MATTTTKSDAPAARPRGVIQAELDAARAKLCELRKLSESDMAKIRKREENIEKAQKRWAKDYPGEPWDPNAYPVPMVPLQPDRELHKQYHRQHYVVARLEEELEAADKAE